MSGPVMRAAAPGSVGLAIAVTVIAVSSSRSSRRGLPVALAAIEQRYGRHGVSDAESGSDLFGALPGWLRSLAGRLSPSSSSGSLQRRLDLAGNPARWTPDRILAVKGLGLVVLGMVGGLYRLRNPLLLILYATVPAGVGLFCPRVLLF